MTIDEVKLWLDMELAAGATLLGASDGDCVVYLFSNRNEIEFPCNSEADAKGMQEIFHDYIGRLSRAEGEHRPAAAPDAAHDDGAP